MPKTAQVTIKLEPELRDRFVKVAARRHRSSTQFLRELMWDAVTEGHTPNAETIAAMEETDRGGGVVYDTVDDMCHDLGIPCER